MTLRRPFFCVALVLAGCDSLTPQTDMLARTWRYYVANPDEIEPMQKICREWTGSSAPWQNEPAVVATNCRAAAFAKAQLKLSK